MEQVGGIACHHVVVGDFDAVRLRLLESTPALSDDAGSAARDTSGDGDGDTGDGDSDTSDGFAAMGDGDGDTSCSPRGNSSLPPGLASPQGLPCELDRPCGDNIILVGFDDSVGHQFQDVDAANCYLMAMKGDASVEVGYVGEHRGVGGEGEAAWVVGDGTAVVSGSYQYDDDDAWWGPTRLTIVDDAVIDECINTPPGTAKWICMKSMFLPECVHGIPACPQP